MTATPTRRSPLLPLAILAVLLSVGFTITANGVQWFWSEVPGAGLLLAVVGVVLGVWHVARQRSARA
jgi:predicted tellurium resistance membrane protein TerC